MNFELTEIQSSWQAKGRSLAKELAIDASAREAILGAARYELLDTRVDLLALAVAVEAIADGSASAAVSYGLHATVACALRADGRWADRLLRGEVIGAVALSAEEVPLKSGGRLTGGAFWVAPAISEGVAILGARGGDGLAAYVVSLGEAGVWMEVERVAGLRGLACARVVLRDAPADRIGATVPVMARVRVLMAAAGLGIGHRALTEALAAARGTGGGAAGEQTVQVLLADAATELDAASLVTWKVAARDGELTLGEASIAKLAATVAAQRAVEHATQVIGIATFRQGHVVERLAQDVRALELLAGRIEGLREAVAEEMLPLQRD